MPIDIRLTALPAPAGVSLAAHLGAVTGDADDGADIAVAVQGATGFGTRVLLRWLSGLGEAQAVTA